MTDDSIFALQQARKRAEVFQAPWDTYRAALIESGLVAEAWQRRHRENFGFECQSPDDCEHYKMAAGQQNMSPEQYAQYSFLGTREALLGIPAPLGQYLLPGPESES